MRIRTLALAAAAMGMIGSGAAVHATNVPTPIGTLGIEDGNGYIVVFDATAPLPFTGYVGITDTPGCAFNLYGGPYEDGAFHTPLPCENFSPGPGVPVPVPIPAAPVPVPALPPLPI